MQSIYPGDTRSALEVFCLYEADGEYFDISDPAQSSGTASPSAKRHRKNQAKAASAASFLICPQKCIDITKKPVVIDQHRCLHCGRCVETYPKQVIEKRV